MIIIPIKWLFHWEYTIFSDKPTYSGDSLRLSDFRCLMLEMLGRACLIWLLGTGPDNQLQWDYSNCMSFPGIPYSNLTEHIWTYQVQDCSFQVIPHVFQFLGCVDLRCSNPDKNMSNIPINHYVLHQNPHWYWIFPKVSYCFPMDLSIHIDSYSY